MLSDSQKEALQRFHYLWKLDNKDWVKERKEQWKYLAENNFLESSAKSLKKNAQYFVKGERDEYIGETIQFLFTPYDSSECARSIFYSSLFTPYDRSQIFSGFINDSSKYGKGLPWLRQHIIWFVDGVMGKNYEIIKEQDGQDYRILSAPPTSICGSYCVKALQVLEGELEYHGVVDYLEYFTSALPDAVDVSFRKHILIDKLISVAESVVKSGSASPLAIDYAKRIVTLKKEILEGWSLNSHLDQEESLE
jgi:hypothetical protein